ncbi:cupin domain-containing protein [Tsuneonella sp. YG55]|uniref:Cupin domain-containing protein n=1 Tax=Tsuneonella litorea TaxID=2976475 RepID=A0A9X2VZG7_9SPHN|nr:cupin domain-containing protein [Tsuneonella litorea]MCT2558113.1 cupin domain-containing protein [Tsuneonella litorea]
MAQVVTGVATFRHDEAWEGRDLGQVGSSHAVLLYADKPYHWHENKQDELFCVLDGTVDMDLRDGIDGAERRVILERGDMALIRKGEEHVAHPRGEARILIVAGGI